MGADKPSESSTWKDFNYSFAVILYLQKIPLVTGTTFQQRFISE
jgi:hypothetical protein